MAPPTGGLPGGAPRAAPALGARAARGGGMFGGDSSRPDARRSPTPRPHGGGTIAVSSQSGAASQIIGSGADVAGIGGFSGRESQVSVDWLANAVRDGPIRWVLADGDGNGMAQDGRIGSTEVMAAAAKVGTSTSIDGLYDLSGHADELRALAG